MRKIPIILLLVSLPIIYLVYTRNAPKPEAVHIHAGFTVYMDGVKQDFSDFKYMNIEPCTEHADKKTKENDQIEKAHLHENVGDVVHVHRSGAVWGDLFHNLNVTFPPGKPVVGFIGGEKFDNILTLPIHENDSVIIISGKSDGIDTSSYVSVDHIKEVESKSELCGNS